MVGDPVLWIVVRPNLFTTLTGADLAAARFAALAGQALLLHLVKACPQDRHCFCLVLKLRLLVLATDDNAGRQVRHTYSRVGGVNALPTRPGGPENVDADVLWTDLHLDLVDFGQHRYRRGRRVDTPLRLGHGHTLHAVYPALPFEPRVSAAPPHLEDHLLETAQPGLVVAKNLGLVAMPLGPAGIHTEQVSGKQAGLIAPGARPDLDDDILVVVRVFQQQQALQLCLALFLLGPQALDLAARQLDHLRIGLFLD